MNLLSARDLAKSYGERSLFTNVGFTIEEGEKVGLVGVNGCGKTTLFRIIAGMERADSGTVSVNRLTTIGYMEQHGFDDLSRGLYEEVHRVFAHLTRMEAELEDIARRIEDGQPDPSGPAGIRLPGGGLFPSAVRPVWRAAGKGAACKADPQRPQPFDAG